MITSPSSKMALLLTVLFFTAVGMHSADAGLIYEETFEGSTPFSGVYKEAAASHSIQFVSTHAYQGSRSARFELRDTDPMVNSGTRAEAMITDPASSRNRWYSFAVFFPSTGYATDSKPELISQWHQYPDSHLGESWTSPPTSLLIQNDQFILDVRHDANTVTTGYMLDTQRLFNLGTVTKDTWHKFVFHIIHSYGSDGLIEVWHNGNKILTHSGGNMLNNVKLPHWKVGVYKWLWNNTGTTDTRLRVLHFDNIKVGNDSATLADMSEDAPAPSPSPSVSASAPPAPGPSPSPSSVSDLQAPSVSLSSPLNGSGVAAKSQVTLTASASDNVAVTKVEFHINGTLHCTDSTAPYSCRWKVGSRRGKTYIIRARAFDAAGNSSFSSESTVTSH